MRQIDDRSLVEDDVIGGIRNDRPGIRKRSITVDDLAQGRARDRAQIPDAARTPQAGGFGVGFGQRLEDLLGESAGSRSVASSPYASSACCDRASAIVPIAS